MRECAHCAARCAEGAGDRCRSPYPIRPTPHSHTRALRRAYRTTQIARSAAGFRPREAPDYSWVTTLPPGVSGIRVGAGTSIGAPCAYLSSSETLSVLVRLPQKARDSASQPSPARANALRLTHLQPSIQAKPFRRDDVGARVRCLPRGARTCSPHVSQRTAFGGGAAACGSSSDLYQRHGTISHTLPPSFPLLLSTPSDRRI